MSLKIKKILMVLVLSFWIINIYAAQGNRSWSIKEIPDTAGALRLSLRVDSIKHPHFVAFNNYYQSVFQKSYVDFYDWNGTKWIKNTVEQVSLPIRGNSRLVKLQLDSADDPHILYVNAKDFKSYDLIYAYRKHGHWLKSKIISNFSGSFDMALDKDGLAHIVYLYHSALYYEVETQPGRWASPEKIQSGTFTNLSITLDKNKVPYIAAKGSDAGCYYIAQDANGNWQAMATGIYLGYSLNDSLCTIKILPETQQPAIVAYTNNYTFVYSAYDGTEWKTQILGYDDRDPAFTIDPRTNQPCIVYRAPNGISFTERDSSGGWHSSQIINATTSPYSLAMDKDSTAYIGISNNLDEPYPAYLVVSK